MFRFLAKLVISDSERATSTFCGSGSEVKVSWKMYHAVMPCGNLLIFLLLYALTLFCDALHMMTAIQKRTGYINMPQQSV